MTRRRLLSIVLGAATCFWVAAAQNTQPPPAQNAPSQPIPFSHKVHAGTLKIECKTCHPNPDPGETMTIAGAATCILCHATIKADVPAIGMLAGYAENRGAVPWERVYVIPSYVFFSHRAHMESSKGNTCEDCHGPVKERDRLFKEADLSMGACMNCHAAKEASNDCSLCHQLSEQVNN